MDNQRLWKKNKDSNCRPKLGELRIRGFQQALAADLELGLHFIL